jgi:hypothetical protein
MEIINMVARNHMATHNSAKSKVALVVIFEFHCV